ncbi:MULTISPECIES: DUF423 domain-containing protein [Parachlamydia]|jgi:uncharacterized membrane protein YgdD (TMEM256/DUF423 family)|uniref:UPF0382 membrane protein SSP2132 n=1 Tax=Parachlamydia acanthamoebae (strain UV7) TaxID=765952 RepID=F8KWU5_PARAV|nr:DUF423 domain-containing protein [Parachlamydia acanthamoebae]EFB42431.1 hypothetical protein pah_c008o043 [Parachlamydia acanthamoebae str. Hall's coccus]CCB86413.1 UPF0382 membrane protein SSP2132 [Parachlamydia acanthamoebae UV-7]
MNLFSSPKILLVLGTLFALAAVTIGSFGAHYLKNRLATEALTTFEIGVRYQMYHALALVLVALICLLYPQAALMTAGWCFVLGMMLFCGSLYALACTGVKWWGAVTPIGGITFLVGWIFFLIGVWKGV